MGPVQGCCRPCVFSHSSGLWQVSTLEMLWLFVVCLLFLHWEKLTEHRFYRTHIPLQACMSKVILLGSQVCSKHAQGSTQDGLLSHVAWAHEASSIICSQFCSLLRSGLPWSQWECQGTVEWQGAKMLLMASIVSVSVHCWWYHEITQQGKWWVIEVYLAHNSGGWEIKIMELHLVRPFTLY